MPAPSDIHSFRLVADSASIAFDCSCAATGCLIRPAYMPTNMLSASAPIIGHPAQIGHPNTTINPIGGRSAVSSLITASIESHSPIDSSTVAVSRKHTDIARKWPYGNRSFGGRNSYRSATMSANEGSIESASVTHAVFIVCEWPVVRYRMSPVIETSTMERHAYRRAWSLSRRWSSENSNG